MSLDSFVEALDNVPPEFERNFTLITDLDKRTQELMDQINLCAREYREKPASKSRRYEIRKRTDELFKKLNSYAEDKLQLALLTYELIDKNIKKMESTFSKNQNEEGLPMLAVDMPMNADEPLYCLCRNVSHGEMIACDNPECKIEWFHLPCVGLMQAPKGKWYCIECQEKFEPVKTARRGSRRSRRR